MQGNTLQVKNEEQNKTKKNIPLKIERRKKMTAKVARLAARLVRLARLARPSNE